VNADNSVAIREALLRDAFFMLPTSGLFGRGLDGFMQRTCIPSHQIHNSPLQAFVEFGWLGGSLFFLLIVSSLVSLSGSARHDDASRFLFCGLVFVVVLSLAHGRFSRDAAVFAFLGGAAGLRQSARFYSVTNGPRT
jgi:hypothetical protein